MLSLLKAFGFLLGAWPLVPYLAVDIHPGSGGVIGGWRWQLVRVFSTQASDVGLGHSAKLGLS